MAENTTNTGQTQLTYSQYEAIRQIEVSNLNKYEEFKSRMKEFDTVHTLEEAKELALKILPTSNELTRFNVGNAKCTIVNRADLLRISLDSNSEFISYNFE